MKKSVCITSCLLVIALNIHAQSITPFAIRKGINISAWLSQSGNTTPAEKKAYFTEKEVKELAALGFDHIRLPVDEKQLFNLDGTKKIETFKLVHQVMKWCKAANMRVIFDCHDLYASRELKAKPGQLSLWESEKAQLDFIQLWKNFSVELKQYPNEWLAYEILNEPVAPDAEQWNSLSNRVISELRKLEPQRVIFLGSNKFNSVTTFPLLKIPKNDPNIVLTFHFYHPGILTHYNQASFEGGAGGGGVKLNYPGKLIPDGEFNRLSVEDKEKLSIQQGTFNKQKLLEKMLNPLEIAKRTGLRVHCGEFGANFKYPDQKLLVDWITDLTNIFKEKQIPYTVWGYRKQFGVFDDNKTVKNQQYLNAIVQ